MDAFITIQKTAGASLYKSLGKCKDIELIYNQYCYPVTINDPFNHFNNFKPFNKKKYNKIYTLVRNPFDNLISYFFTRMGVRVGWGYCHLYHDWYNSFQIDSLTRFIDAYIDPIFNWHFPPMKRSMNSFIYDKNGDLIIDKYFKLEHIHELNLFLEKYKCNPLQHLNSNKDFQLKMFKSKNYQLYTPSQVKKLEKIWEQDLNYFNYQYEGQ